MTDAAAVRKFISKWELNAQKESAAAEEYGDFSFDGKRLPNFIT